MSEKRKDSAGRILKSGGSQRANGSYMFRYYDVFGSRKCVYAPNLDVLREKEKAVGHDLEEQIDYDSGKITVIDQAKRYLALRTDLSRKTVALYKDAYKWIERHPISQRKIRDVKMSEAKLFIIDLSQNEGLSFNTIAIIQSILRPALQIAVDDEVLRRNPFQFCLSKVIPKVENKRQALTALQKQAFLNFLQSDSIGKRHYDSAVILLGTGLRISELCGLTLNDLDFENRRIQVDKQLSQLNHYGIYVNTPKTKSGERFVPMSDEVFAAFQRVLQERKIKNEPEVDGYRGFVFLNRYGRPKRAKSFQVSYHDLILRYNETHEASLKITPHVLRHTFCTDLAAKKIDIKSLQYIMGHKDVETTLNVYAHSNYETAAESMLSVLRKSS